MIKRIIKAAQVARRPLNRVSRATVGFTLVEMITVLAIISILTAVSLPAIEGIQKQSNFTRSVDALSDSINLAHAYALAEGTYTYVGLSEVDRLQDAGATPQAPGLGRVALGLVASRDGTDTLNAQSSSPQSYNAGSNLTLVRPPTVLDMLYIAPAFPAATTGGMARPSVNVENIQSGSSASTLFPANLFPSSPFSLPLGSSLNQGKYNFTSAISFNPNGAIVVNGQAVQWLEIDLQPCWSDTSPPPPSSGNEGAISAVLIDGGTGAVTLYRP